MIGMQSEVTVNVTSGQNYNDSSMLISRRILGITRTNNVLPAQGSKINTAWTKSHTLFYRNFTQKFGLYKVVALDTRLN